MIELTDETLLNLLEQQKFPDDNFEGKALVLISTPTCVKCKALYTPDNLEKIEKDAGNSIHVYHYDFKAGNKKVADHFTKLSLMGVPCGLAFDLGKDKIKKSDGIFTSVESVINFAKTLD